MTKSSQTMTKSPQTTPSKPLFHKLGVLQFKDLVKLETAIMHNLKESSRFFNTSPRSISAIHKHHTRQSNNITTSYQESELNQEKNP